MTSGNRRFQTTAGVLTVDCDAIRLCSTPGQFIAAQRAHWRAGDPSERMKSAARIVWLLFALVFGLGYFVYEAHRVLNLGFSALGIVATVFLMTGIYALWANHLRERTVPLSSVERISFDEANRAITIRYETSRLDTILLGHTGRQRMQFPTDADLREVRETLRLEGITVEDETEQSDTVYRFVVEDGVYFCESCARQVSPADSTCPSCDYALRVDASERSSHKST